MTRIAHFIDTRHSGGAERVVVDLCGKLAEMGHEVEVLHFGNAWIAEHAAARGFSTVTLDRRPWYVSKWTVAAFSIYLGRLLRQHRIDLLHSHLNGAVAAGAIAAVTAGIPHVGTLHDVFHIEQRPKRFNQLRMAAALGTQLVAVSEGMRRFYSGLSNGRIFFERIYNGVDASAFRRGTRRPGERFTFVSMGRLVPIKGFDVLLEALARTGSSGPSLRIMGEGRGRAGLEARAAALGLKERVEFLGFRDDVDAVLSDADAFVLASRSEGLSCSLVEAMAAGLPCVATDVGGNREVVLEGETGFLVPPEDPDALASRLLQLTQERSLARALGDAGRRRAEMIFTLDATVRSYGEIYSALLPPVSQRKRIGAA